MRLTVFLKIILVGITSLILIGCTWCRDRSNDYVGEEASCALQVPADTNPEPFSTEYYIP